jgi:hypothetical protein
MTTSGKSASMTSSSGTVPYSPSWSDRLISWIDRLPGPNPVIYVIGYFASVLFTHIIIWIDGVLQPGSFSIDLIVEAFYILYPLAAYHYLTGVGSRALKTFRPLLAIDDHEVPKIEYELSTLPRRYGWLAIVLGIGLDILSIPYSSGGYLFENARTYLVRIGEFIVLGFIMTTFFALILRSLKQLRAISRLHKRATKIDLLNLEPVHAFSGLTARTGGFLILLLLFGALTDVSLWENSGDSFLFYFSQSIATALLAIGIFIIPLLGMQFRLREEKEQSLGETNRLLRAASDRLHQKIQEEDYGEIEGTNEAIEALIREISTWPWDPGTIRGFGSTLLLPIFLLLVTRLLEIIF